MDMNPEMKPVENQGEKNGYAIASMVLGICSIVLGVCLGGILGVLGIIFGIIALSGKQGKQGFAIAGLVTAAIGLLIFIGCIVFAVAVYKEEGNVFGDTMQRMIEDAEAEANAAALDWLEGNTYISGDGSELILNEDGTFEWYMEEGAYDDNCASGSYEVYYQQDAEDYIVDELTEYGVERSELQDYYEMNEGSEFYLKDCFCIMVLNNESIVMDGEEQIEEAFVTPYMGFYLNGYYDAANMNNGEHASFQLKE